MAYDEAVAARVRAALAGAPRVQERRMFGGIAFMVRGHMVVGVQNDELMVRVGPRAYTRALTRPHAREMDFTGRPLKGFVYVAPAGFRTDRDLNAWVKMALAFARAQPAKTARPGKELPRKKAQPARKPRPSKKKQPPGRPVARAYGSAASRPARPRAREAGNLAGRKGR
jgi:TfoX/Sxy family transcriptional regulator of competence genes